MKPTTYICERYPALSIGGIQGKEVKFRRGRFIATRPWEVELIESNDVFGVFIVQGHDHDPEPVSDQPQAKHVSAKRGDETEHQPPKGGDQTHIREVKGGEAKTGQAPVNEAEAGSEEAKELARAAMAAPEYKVSKTAGEILEKAGISVREAAATLGLEDGDRLTVKMAEELLHE